MKQVTCNTVIISSYKRGRATLLKMLRRLFNPIAVSLLLCACVASLEDNVNHVVSSDVDVSTFERRYRCDSGQVLLASYTPPDLATVYYRGNVYTMEVGVSASGSRYVDEGLEWWTRGAGVGAEGRLSLLAGGRVSGAELERCVEY